MELGDLGTHLDSQLGVQVGQRFVHQEDLRASDDGAAHGHTLSLSTGERLGLAVQQLLQIQDLRRLTHLAVDLILGDLPQGQGKRHVVVDRHMGIERIVLKNHGDVSVLRLYIVHFHTVDQKFAFGDVLQSRDHPQGRGLPAAGWSDENDEFLVFDFQIEIRYRMVTIRIDLLNSS